MALLEMQAEPKKGSVRGRESRNQTLNTKLTVAEFAELEAVSRAESKAPGEWLRDAALGVARLGQRDDKMMVLLTEIVGVQLLLMNVLKPIATGQPLSGTAFDNIVAGVHKLKQPVACKLVQEGK
jgi:hypothetical protein